MNITFEERQLMSLYNTGTRTGLIAALEEMRGYLAADETELRELTDSAIAKLRRMSDAEYDALDLFPDFEKEDMDDRVKYSSMRRWQTARRSRSREADQKWTAFLDHRASV